jgi:hypothetical protein
MLQSFISRRDFQGHSVPGRESMLMQIEIRPVEQPSTSIENSTIWRKEGVMKAEKKKRERDGQTERQI